MSQNVLNDAGQAPSSPSNASQPQDLIALASALHEAVAQVLLKYGETIDRAEPFRAEAPSQSEQDEQATSARVGLLEPDLLTGEQCIRFSYYPMETEPLPFENCTDPL